MHTQRRVLNRFVGVVGGGGLGAGGSNEGQWNKLVDVKCDSRTGERGNSKEVPVVQHCRKTGE